MAMRKYGYCASIAVVVLLALVMAACEQKTINQIMANPSHYSNREVGIVGRVVQSYSVLGKGGYEVDDGTGKLWIVSDKGVPREGARVAVRGTIRDAYNIGKFGSFGKLPEAVRAGMVMIEISHKAK
ncbi:MAG TPA: hypothetical protein VMG30_18545 [Acidobacteriota bacterium]|nr:hypothetical protein [Acidobacteriota bacterium]